MELDAFVSWASYISQNVRPLHKSVKAKKALANFVTSWLLTDINSAPSSALVHSYVQEMKGEQAYSISGPREVPSHRFELRELDSSIIFTHAGVALLQFPYSQESIRELYSKYRGDATYAFTYSCYALAHHDFETSGLPTKSLSIPRNIASRLSEAGYRQEAFANALTSSLVLYSDDAWYHSSLPFETFGGRSSFFSSAVTRPCICMPPFGDFILERAADLCLRSPLPILFIGPEWKDSPFWAKLSKATKFHRQVKIPFLQVETGTLLKTIPVHVWILGDGLIRQTDEIVDEWCDMFDA